MCGPVQWPYAMLLMKYQNVLKIGKQTKKARDLSIWSYEIFWFKSKILIGKLIHWNIICASYFLFHKNPRNDDNVCFQFYFATFRFILLEIFPSTDYVDRFRIDCVFLLFVCKCWAFEHIFIYFSKNLVHFYSVSRKADWTSGLGTAFLTYSQVSSSYVLCCFGHFVLLLIFGWKINFLLLKILNKSQPTIAH